MTPVQDFISALDHMLTQELADLNANIAASVVESARGSPRDIVTHEAWKRAAGDRVRKRFLEGPTSRIRERYIEYGVIKL